MPLARTGGVQSAARIGLAVLVALILAPACASGPVGAAAEPRDGYHLYLAKSRELGPAPPGRTMSLALVLANLEAAGLGSVLASIYDPGSSRFGHFLTPATAARFGPSPSRAARVVNRLRAAGLAAGWAAGTAFVTVRGAVAALSRVFGVQVSEYAGPDGVHFLASARDPQIPTVLAADVAGVAHLTDRTFVQHSAIRPGGLQPLDLQSFYDAGPLRALGIDGSGQTVVIWAAGDNVSPAHLHEFNRRFGLPDVLPVLAGGPALGSTAEGGELAMDVETVHEVAPGARIVVYTTPIATNPEVVTAEAPMLAANPGAIFNFSIGTCETVLTQAAALAAARLYDQADATGSSIFAASGDLGAYSCEAFGQHPSDAALGLLVPAAFPGVTAVGGTTAAQDTHGGRYDEVTWESPDQLAGSGGGPSAYFALPDWQRRLGGTVNQFNSTHRVIPDVSAVADPATGTAIYTHGTWLTGGGTSLSSPIWAGFAALIDQYLARSGGHQAGFLNPALYAIAARSGQPAAFHDVTVGGNLAYPAGPGYDMATGIGTPDVWNLAHDLLALQRQ